MARDFLNIQHLTGNSFKVEGVLTFSSTDSTTPPVTTPPTTVPPVPVAPGAVAQSPSTGDIVTMTDKDIVSLSPLSAVNSIKMPPGTKDQQMVVLLNMSTNISNSITFADESTSKVSGGVSNILPGLSFLNLQWRSSDSLWHKV